jgi:hypothetical protein
MSEYAKRLEKRIKRLKKSYGEQNDWRSARIAIQRRGGKWKADNGTIFEVRDGVVYQYFSEAGISMVVIAAYDAPIPYVAQLDIDLQFVSPEKRRKFLEDLDKEVRNQAAGPQAEMIVIVEKDWLSKISQKRWGTINWKQHLKPTQMTLAARKRRNERFDPDVIYPGDTFEVNR